MRSAGESTAQAILPQVQPSEDVHMGGVDSISLPEYVSVLENIYCRAGQLLQGTVGLGGVYMCIYPMNSPGGYQLMGRTLPIWNTFCASTSFAPGKPWLLEIFDQIRFYEVTEEQLTKHRRDFTAGSFHVDITEEVFDFAEHRRFCESLELQVAELRKRQAAAAAEVMAKDAAILAGLEGRGYTPGGKGAVENLEDNHAQYDGDEFTKAWLTQLAAAAVL